MVNFNLPQKHPYLFKALLNVLLFPFFVRNPSDLHIRLDNTHWMAGYFYKDKYLNSEGEYLFVFQFYFNFYLFKDKYSHSGGEFLLTCTQSIPYRPNMSEKIKTEPYNAMQ